MALVDFISGRVLHYRFDADGVSLVGPLGRWTVPYWQIESVRSLAWIDCWLDPSLSGFKLRWWTTRILTRKLVVVRHRDGRALMCSPDDPDDFVRLVNARIAGTAPPRLPDQQVLQGQHPPRQASSDRASR